MLENNMTCSQDKQIGRGDVKKGRTNGQTKKGNTSTQWWQRQQKINKRSHLSQLMATTMAVVFNNNIDAGEAEDVGAAGVGATLVFLCAFSVQSQLTSLLRDHWLDGEGDHFIEYGRYFIFPSNFTYMHRCMYVPIKVGSSELSIT